MLGEESEVPRHNQKCKKEPEKREENDREVPEEPEVSGGPGEPKNGRDKPEVPGRFQECEQGVHVVVPLTL
jgi:hypothetical protein